MFKEQEFSAEGRGRRQGAPGGVCTLMPGMSVPVAGWHWGPVAVGTEGATGGTHWGEIVWLGSAVISKPGVRPGAQWALCWARVYQWPGGAGAL